MKASKCIILPPIFTIYNARNSYDHYLSVSAVEPEIDAMMSDIFYIVSNVIEHFIGIFQTMFHFTLVIAVCMVSGHNCVSNGVNYIQGPNDVFLNCIDVTSRSITDCALRASHMEHYENRFAYRNGKCHVCRADNENCVISVDEYKLAGPHFVKGRILCIIFQVGINMNQNAVFPWVVASDVLLQKHMCGSKCYPTIYLCRYWHFWEVWQFLARAKDDTYRREHPHILGSWSCRCSDTTTINSGVMIITVVTCAANYMNHFINQNCIQTACIYLSTILIK